MANVLIVHWTLCSGDIMHWCIGHCALCIGHWSSGAMALMCIVAVALDIGCNGIDVHCGSGIGHWVQRH